MKFRALSSTLRYQLTSYGNHRTDIIGEKTKKTQCKTILQCCAETQRYVEGQRAYFKHAPVSKDFTKNHPHCWAYS